MADVRGVWRDTDFASSLQHFIFLRRAKFHGFKRTLTFSHAKATTKGPLEMSIRFGLFVHFLDENSLNCIEDMRVLDNQSFFFYFFNNALLPKNTDTDL